MSMKLKRLQFKTLSTLSSKPHTMYISSEVLQSALTRAGKDLTREKFLLALEQLSDFRTGLVPPITYGPKQRLGSRKAELVCVDVLSHSFEPTCSQPAKGK